MEQNNIMRFFGVLKDLNWNEKENKIEHLRSSFTKKLEKNPDKKFKAF